MIVLDLLQIVVSADSCTDESMCPASAFTALAAAFATQGYYVQADFIWWLINSGLGKLTGLIYLLAGMGAIVGYVLGSPPKNYLWFLIGPAVYYWLVANPIRAQGVRWLSANAQTTTAQQKEVWRLAEAGLAGSNYLKRNGLVGQVSNENPPPPAEVAMPFLWADELTSDLFSGLVEITGVYELPSAAGNTQRPGVTVPRKNWSILTDLKWSMIEDITAARFQNGDARDAFVTFLSSECGDVFSQQIDEGKWITASLGDDQRVPNSVLKFSSIFGWNTGTIGATNLALSLRREAIPIPDSFRNLVRADDAGLFATITGTTAKRFSDSAPFFRQTLAPYIERNSSIGGLTCDGYLWILVHAFLHETGHRWFQAFNNGPGEFKDQPDDVLHSLFYGWDLKGPNSAAAPTAEDLRNFAKNLIFVHLVRNEFAMAPQPVSVRYAASKDSETYVDEFARTLGSKTKYGEIYSWALMMPYIQGITLYVLAMAYPFAAMMVVIPGWHKVIITWFSFWVWVKSWDLGFAVIKVLERSVWAMLGNGSNAEIIHEKLKEMPSWGTVQTTCSGANCVIPDISYAPDGTQGLIDQVQSFMLFDRAMALGSNLDLDLTNSYYVYVITAMTLAMPGVMGQITLGAKAGASSLVGGMVSGFSDKVSAAAGTGYTGDITQKAQTNSASVGQAAFGKNMRNGGLMAQAIDQGNASAMHGLDASGQGTVNGLMSNLGQTGDRVANRHAAMMSPFRTAIDSTLAPFASGNPNSPNSNPAMAGNLPGATAGATAGATQGASPGNPGSAGWTGGPFAGQGARYLGGLSRLAKPNSYAGLATGSEISKAMVQGDNMDYQNEVTAGNSDRSVGQFMSGAGKDQTGMHGQRMEGYAGWDAANKTWANKRDFGNQVAGKLAVSGVLPGSMAPGQKPDPGKDSAMSGILNSYSGNMGGGAFSGGAVSMDTNTAGLANYMAPGGGFSQRTTAWSGQMAPIAGGAVRDAYAQGRATMGSAAGAAIANQPAMYPFTGGQGNPQITGALPSGAGPSGVPKP